MAAAVDQLTQIQLGQEATGARGTAVAQTTRWVGTGIVENDEPKYWGRAQNGLMIPRSQRGTIGSRKARLTLDGDLTFEQACHILNMGMCRVVTGSGGGADKTFQFTPSVSADPVIQTFTVGYRKTDGTTSWDERITYLFAESWEISAALGENAKIKAECVGRPVELATAITGAVPVPSVNYIPTALFKVYINDTFGALGTTQKLGTVIGFSLKYNGPYQPKDYIEGRSDRSFSSHSLKDSDYSLEIQTEFTADMLLEQQKADDEPGALRYIRIDAVGPSLGGSNYQLQIDGAFEYEQAGFNIDGSRDGNGTCTLKLVGSYDVTNSLGLKIKSVNAMATLT